MNLLRAISNLFRFDRTNWKALALSLVAAAVFWLFTALNKEYATNLKFPLVLEFDNTKYIPIEPLPTTLQLNVQGNGWELFRKGLGFRVPQLKYTIDRPTETLRIPGSAMTPVFAAAVSPLQLNFVVIDTLRMQFDTRMHRKVKLVADVSQVTFRKNMGQTSAVKVTPDSVMLDGPSNLLTILPDSVVIQVAASRVGTHFSSSVEVALPGSELISRNPPVADISFDVGALTETSQRVKVRAPATPWGIELENDSVTVVMLVPAEGQKRLASDGLSVYLDVDYSIFRKGERRSFLPRIKGLPPFSQLLHVDSVRVRRY